MDNKEAAFAMFAEGKAINLVANSLFKKNWGKAKKLHREWQAANGIEVVQPQGADDAAEEWDLTVKVPTSHLGKILNSFTAAEQATAIQGVLQARLDAALEAGS